MGEGSVEARGGDASIGVDVPDLMRTAELLKRAAADLDAIAAQCSGFALTVVASSAPDASGSLAAAVVGIRADADRLRALGEAVRHAAEAYLRTEIRWATGFGDPLKSLLHTGWSVLKFGAAVSQCSVRQPGCYGTAVAGLGTDDPELVDLLMGLYGPALVALGTAIPDGRPVVTDAGLDRRVPATLPPRRLVDLMLDLSWRNRDVDGAVDVKFLTGPDGTRRVIVDIPGTKQLNPLPSSTAPSLNAGARALVGLAGTYENGVVEAMRRAGVRPQDPVLLVGHSLGGMVAVDIARRAEANGGFHVTHVVTAGAPIGRTVGSLPASVQVLALENRHDVVPHLDGRDNPDRPNVLTVTVEHDDRTVTGNHDLDAAYGPGADDAQRSGEPAVANFLDGVRHYFEATEVEAHRFVITRGN